MSSPRTFRGHREQREREKKRNANRVCGGGMMRRAGQRAGKSRRSWTGVGCAPLRRSAGRERKRRVKAGGHYMAHVFIITELHVLALSARKSPSRRDREAKRASFAPPFFEDFTGGEFLRGRGVGEFYLTSMILLEISQY